jgi:hypothetical protein
MPPTDGTNEDVATEEEDRGEHEAPVRLVFQVFVKDPKTLLSDFIFEGTLEN